MDVPMLSAAGSQKFENGLTSRASIRDQEVSNVVPAEEGVENQRMQELRDRLKSLREETLDLQEKNHEEVFKRYPKMSNDALHMLESSLIRAWHVQNYTALCGTFDIDTLGSDDELRDFHDRFDERESYGDYPPDDWNQTAPSSSPFGVYTYDGFTYWVKAFDEMFVYMAKVSVNHAE